MTPRWVKGQALVETVFLLPLLLLVLVGTHICLRASFLDSAAEGAAHAQAIRAGRQLVGIERQMSESILPEGDGVRIRANSDNKARLLPFPFPGLTGRTKGITEIQSRWEETFGMARLPPLQLNRPSEMSVDCWERRSPSGKKIRGVVSGMVATGVFR